ncbi:hypothetical protein [Amycolatopsis minnesotensis]|uniref:Uncharacterized protein n=1 Tax=Amycolatopsis minnesotensis TaxID=337894 RepID=A0ABN2R6G8_9PSEU
MRSTRPHGSSTLFAELPSDRGQALYAACDRDAVAKKRQGDKRTMDQLRLDALVERCLGGHGCAGKPKAQIFVHIDLPTLPGLRDNPADLAGCGDISPDMARTIAFAADSVRNRIIDEPTDLDHTTAWKDGGRTDETPPT